MKEETRICLLVLELIILSQWLTLLVTHHAYMCIYPPHAYLHSLTHSPMKWCCPGHRSCWRPRPGQTESRRHACETLTAAREDDWTPTHTHTHHIHQYSTHVCIAKRDTVSVDFLICMNSLSCSRGYFVVLNMMQCTAPSFYMVQLQLSGQNKPNNLISTHST